MGVQDATASASSKSATGYVYAGSRDLRATPMIDAGVVLSQTMQTTRDNPCAQVGAPRAQQPQGGNSNG